jgi:hypothetical protein
MYHGHVAFDLMVNMEVAVTAASIDNANNAKHSLLSAYFSIMIII